MNMNLLKLSAMLLGTNIRIEIYGLKSIYSWIFMSYLLLLVCVCEEILLWSGKLHSRFIPAFSKFATEYSSAIITVWRKFIKI
jgi:hypothetical protein